MDRDKARVWLAEHPDEAIFWEGLLFRMIPTGRLELWHTGVWLNGRLEPIGTYEPAVRCTSCDHQQIVPCDKCHGSGWLPPEPKPQPCPACGTAPTNDFYASGQYRCGQCGLRSPASHVRTEAVERWNRIRYEKEGA